MNPVDVVIREICIPAIRADQASEEHRPALVEFARESSPTPDLLARVAIAALSPVDVFDPATGKWSKGLALLVASDTVADFEILDALRQLEVSPAVQADVQDCLEAVLDEMDQRDKVSEAIAGARPAFSSMTEAMRSFAGAASLAGGMWSVRMPPGMAVAAP